MCGILGTLLADHDGPAAADLLEGCHYLQHRGQDAAGIMTCEPRGRLYQCKGNGMVREVFTPSSIKNLTGNMGIAHLRYPTAGSSSTSEAQPFYVNSPYGLSLAHNGNLVSAQKLKSYMDEVVHRHINTDSDSELLLNAFACKLQEFNKRRINPDDIVEALRGVYEIAEGAYACVAMIAGYGIVGFRDAHAIRPLCYGYRDTAAGRDWMMASENIALQALGFKGIKDVLPGQAVIVTKNQSEPFLAQVVPPKSYSPCIFEYVYFARPDSVIDGISVYRSRLEMGKNLADNIISQFGSLSAVKDAIDVVIPVPDTANAAALATSAQLKITYREGFVKNRYVGRTFIMPNQQERRSSVRRKLNANPYEFTDKSVLLVDDSIVRGTTSYEIVQMAREAGARRVYFASCAPPIRNNHIYGIDLADSRALVAHGRTEEEIKRELGCDGLFYQKLEDLIAACRNSETARNGEHYKSPLTGFEVGVFNGQYCTGVGEDYFEHLNEIRVSQRPNVLKSNSEINIFNSHEGTR